MQRNLYIVNVRFVLQSDAEHQRSLLPRWQHQSLSADAALNEWVQARRLADINVARQFRVRR
jgi:hypothetical protein